MALAVVMVIVVAVAAAVAMKGRVGLLRLRVSFELDAALPTEHSSKVAEKLDDARFSALLGGPERPDGHRLAGGCGGQRGGGEPVVGTTNAGGGARGRQGGRHLERAHRGNAGEEREGAEDSHLGATA